jgi:hypothetical protein
MGGNDMALLGSIPWSDAIIRTCRRNDDHGANDTDRTRHHESRFRG